MSMTIAPPDAVSEFNDDLPLDTPTLLKLYAEMLLIRRFELVAQDVYKKGEMPGFIHLYVGQEAVAVGACAHLRSDDWITSTHRGHGHAIAKGVPPEQVMAELYARVGGACGGRGGSMHLYAPKYGLLGTNGFVGGGIPSTVGLGLSARTRGTDQVAVAFFGDGAVNHGSFHESVNFAGAQKAPVVFICENNLYATATPLATATANPEVATKAVAYGIPGVAVDGNDVIAVWEAMRDATERARAGRGPTLIEAKTYRTVGHHEGDPLVGTYRTQEELDSWKTRCPIANFRRRLLEAGRATESEIDEIDRQVEERVMQALEFARKSPHPDAATAVDHVWAEPLHPDLPAAPEGGETKVQGWLEAVRDGIAEEMRRDPNIIYLGEGTGERGGSFAHTKGLWHEFGANRLIDTPISELGFTGAAIGASGSGCRTIADLMFADFIFDAASQVIEQAAKLRYMSNGQISVPMIVRSSWGSVKQTGPHHSGAYHPIWAHCSGLIVVVPSNPADAKGLMKTALRSHDPVMFLEPKALFSSKGEVPTGEYFIPFGVASVAREGADITIVTCGTLVHRCLEAAEVLAEQGVSAEIIDLRTIQPLDVDTIAASFEKTRHLLIVDEAFSMCGIGGEIALAMMEQAFHAIDVPIGRLHTETTAHPFSPEHENAIVVSVEKIVEAAHAVKAGEPIVPRRLSAGQRRAAARRPSAPAIATSAAKPAAGNAAANLGTGVAVIMPNQDLTVTEGRVIAWLKKIGEPVLQGETIAEVETEKAVVPIEAPTNGRLTKILIDVEGIAQMGETMGVVEPSNCGC